MPQLANKNLAELNAMTKAQLITAILAGVTDSETITEYGPHGQTRQTTVMKSRATGEVVSRQTITWSYFENGDVREIVVSERNTANKEAGRRAVLHYRDGRQPEVIG